MMSQSGPYELKEKKREYTNAMFGAGIGLFSKKMRGWAGYYWHDSIEDNNLFLKYDAKGVKATFGVAIRPTLFVNVEFIYHNLFVLRQFGQMQDLGDMKMSVLYISVSSPIDIRF